MTNQRRFDLRRALVTVDATERTIARVMEAFWIGSRSAEPAQVIDLASRRAAR